MPKARGSRNCERDKWRCAWSTLVPTKKEGWAEQCNNVDKTAQTGQRLTTSQIIYLFSEHFPPVMFPVSLQKGGLRFHIPVPAFLHLVTKASSSIHPALTYWWTETKVRFPNCSDGPLFLFSFFLYYAQQNQSSRLLLKQKKSEKTCVWKEDVKFEGKLSIANSCGFISQVLWYFDFIFF